MALFGIGKNKNTGEIKIGPRVEAEKPISREELRNQTRILREQLIGKKYDLRNVEERGRGALTQNKEVLEYYITNNKINLIPVVKVEVNSDFSKEQIAEQNPQWVEKWHYQYGKGVEVGDPSVAMAKYAKDSSLNIAIVINALPYNQRLPNELNTHMVNLMNIDPRIRE